MIVHHIQISKALDQQMLEYLLTVVLFISNCWDKKHANSSLSSSLFIAIDLAPITYNFKVITNSRPYLHQKILFYLVPLMNDGQFVIS